MRRYLVLLCFTLGISSALWIGFGEVDYTPESSRPIVTTTIPELICTENGCMAPTLVIERGN